MPKQQRSALRKLFIPTRRKLHKTFLRDIYQNIQTFVFHVFREFASKAFGNGVVQMFFSDTNQKHVCWKICKVSKVFCCVAEVYFLQY